MIQLTRTSSLTNSTSTMTIPLALEAFMTGIRLWQGGTYIQDAFPTLSPDHREFIKTGITPTEWETFVGQEDE